MSTHESFGLERGTRPSARARARLLIVTSLGLALAAYVLKHIGFRAVLAAATSVGTGGFALLCAYAFVVFGVLGPAWYMVVPRSAQLRLRVFLWARMVRDAASEALPFSQVGGMILGVRAASVLGAPTRLAVGSMIVDVTTELLGQVGYVALGLLILNARASHAASAHASLAHALVHTFLIGLAVAAVAGGSFLALQRRGFSWIADRLATRTLPVSASYAAGIAAVLQEIYRAPWRIALSVCIHFCGWIAGAMGTWLAFRLIGINIGAGAVIAIESLVYAARSVAFFVPNALGIQEAAYALLAPLFGIGKEYALAVSLLKRARDITIGIPILLVWQLIESRRVLGRSVAYEVNSVDPES